MAIIGIDLGTTNSLVAYWSSDGAHTIPNALGEKLTPSVVSVDESGQIFVGEIAKERMISHPSMTAACFKRQMGTKKKYQLGKFAFSPEELSSFVLRSLKEDAEHYLGEEIKTAVISVPAYFNDDQRRATKCAAELAGLYVERLISEPTAAAIAYGMHQRDCDTSFVVLDLGGGTFDVSVLEMYDNIMEVKSVAGDMYLGGEDFTEALAKYYLQESHFPREKLDDKTRALVFKQSEKCKRELTVNDETIMTISVDGADYSLPISRTDFESISSAFMNRLRQPIERALRDAQIDSTSLDAVILVGGATRMPSIKSAMAKIFRRLPYTNINPDETIALGAAVQAALKVRCEDLQELILTDVCPFSLGTAVAHLSNGSHSYDVTFYPVIERNSTIPISRVETFCTITDNQSVIRFKIYQGESRNVENNLYLGEIEIGVPKGPRGSEGISVRYTYDINGILEVESCVLSTKEKKRIVIESHHSNMTPDEIEKSLARIATLKIHPRDKTENRLLIARAERLFEELLGEERSYLNQLLLSFQAILDLQDAKKEMSAAREFKKKLDQLDGRSVL